MRTLSQRESDILFVIVVLFIILACIVMEGGRQQREIQQMLDTYPYNHSQIPLK